MFDRKFGIPDFTIAMPHRKNRFAQVFRVPIDNAPSEYFRVKVQGRLPLTHHSLVECTVEEDFRLVEHLGEYAQTPMGSCHLQDPIVIIAPGRNPCKGL